MRSPGGVQNALDVGGLGRPVTDAALGCLDFEKRLEPEKPPRTVTHKRGIELAARDFGRDRMGHRLRAHRERRHIAGDKNAHAQSCPPPTRARIFASSARPCTSPSTMTAGDNA